MNSKYKKTNWCLSWFLKLSIYWELSNIAYRQECYANIVIVQIIAKKGFSQTSHLYRWAWLWFPLFHNHYDYLPTASCSSLTFHFPRWVPAEHSELLSQSCPELVVTFQTLLTFLFQVILSEPIKSALGHRNKPVSQVKSKSFIYKRGTVYAEGNI